MNETFICAQTPGEYILLGTDCGCNNGKVDTFETDIDCGGEICPSCKLGQTCFWDGDCLDSDCVNSKCTAATAAADWKAGVGAFVAALAVVMLTAGILAYFCWWRHAGSAATAANTTKEFDQEMATLSAKPEAGHAALDVPDVHTSDVPTAEHEEVYVS